MAAMWKADIIKPRDAYTSEQLARRQRVELAGVAICFTTAEDTIVAKNDDRSWPSPSGISTMSPASSA